LQLDRWDIGIIASVLWILGGGWYGNHVGWHQGDAAINSYAHCQSYPCADLNDCLANSQRQYSEAVADHWLMAGWYAFLALIFEGLAVLAVMLIRWVMHPADPSPPKSIPRSPADFR
jgi:hypothetical protein